MGITLIVAAGLGLTVIAGSKEIAPVPVSNINGDLRISHTLHPSLITFSRRQGKYLLNNSANYLKIIGGTASNITQHPYQVAINNGNSFVCAGALLNRIWVLALASCTDGAHPSDLTVRVGSDFGTYGGTVYCVTELLTHPKYIDANLDYDFSMLKLEAYLCFGEDVGQVSLPTKPPPPEYVGSISGWGADGVNSTSVLRQLEMSVVSTQKCRQQYNVTRDTITERMFCAKANSAGPCFNDFGDPFVVNGTLYGLYSWSRGCALYDYPAVFANLASETYWIRQTMENSCSCGMY